MSSRREVLIRILALLQRKTLIETKNRTLKWHYWTVRSIKNVALLTEDGAFALFFRPHPGGFASSRVPTPGNLPSKAKKMLIPGGQPGGGGPGRRWKWLMHKRGTVDCGLRTTEYVKHGSSIKYELRAVLVRPSQSPSLLISGSRSLARLPQKT